MRGLYPVDDKRIHDLKERFTYHGPLPGQAERYVQLRDLAFHLAMTIATTTPPGRDQAVALTHLEETVMWANKAIACGETTKSLEVLNAGPVGDATDQAPA